MFKTAFLFFITASCETIGCLLPWLWFRRGVTVWLLIPARVLLTLFVWLLMLHPAASECVYVACGGVYVVTVLLWLRIVGSVKLSLYGWSDALVALCGMLIIMAGWGRA